MSALTSGNNWLSQLAPDRLPAPVSWWPMAPGWWIVAILCVAAILILVLWIRNPRRRLSKLALHEITLIEQQGKDPQATASAIENVLRRLALVRFGRSRIARLSGDRWLEFLVAEGAQALSGQAGHTLLAAAYGSQTTDMRSTWLQGARQFIRKSGHHRREKCST